VDTSVSCLASPGPKAGGQSACGRGAGGKCGKFATTCACTHQATEDTSEDASGETASNEASSKDASAKGQNVPRGRFHLSSPVTDGF